MRRMEPLRVAISNKRVSSILLTVQFSTSRTKLWHHRVRGVVVSSEFNLGSRAIKYSSLAICFVQRSFKDEANVQRMFVDRTITCWKYRETLQPNNKPCFVIYERYLRTSDTAHIPSGQVSHGFRIHCSIASTFCQSPEIQLSSTHCHAVRCTSMNRRNTLSKTEIFTSCHTNTIG